MGCPSKKKLAAERSQFFHLSTIIKPEKLVLIFIKTSFFVFSMVEISGIEPLTS